MESSSNDSFLWTDASNDSVDNNKHKNASSIEDQDYKKEPEADRQFKQNNKSNSDNETRTKSKKTKKRKYSEDSQESNVNSISEKKRIKLEPHSILDIDQTRLSENEAKIDNNIDDSNFYGEEYLNLKVKEEQSTPMQTKKKKKQSKSYSNSDNTHESDPAVEEEQENYLEMRVKEEQISVIEPDNAKSKKKKKHKTSIFTSDTEIANISNSDNKTSETSIKSESYINETVRKPSKKKKKDKSEEGSINSSPVRNNSADSEYTKYLSADEKFCPKETVVAKLRRKKYKTVTTINNNSDVESIHVPKNIEIVSEAESDNMTSVKNNSIDSEHDKYYNVEEKFCAEETVVERPRKKKHKTDANIENNAADIDPTHVWRKVEICSEAESENIKYNDNDMTLEPNDFSCTNIVSSTIINTSVIDPIQNKQLDKTNELLKKSKNSNTGKISDRIIFEEDENSIQKQLVPGQISAKIDMFLKANPHLELCPPKTLKHSKISKDDDIWTLTWPHKIDLDKLRNTTISSEGKCKIKIEGQTYEGVLNEDVKGITLLTSDQSGQAFVTTLVTKNCINFHKRIPKVHMPVNNIMLNNQTTFTPLPEIKNRHPLFGARYKKAIKISTAIADRLQAAKELCRKTKSGTGEEKKLKKSKRKLVEIKIEEEDENPKSLKKNRKRKNSQDNNVSSKKLKRIKHCAESPVVWESEKAIEKNLFDF